MNAHINILLQLSLFLYIFLCLFSIPIYIYKKKNQSENGHGKLAHWLAFKKKLKRDFIVYFFNRCKTFNIEPQ